MRVRRGDAEVVLAELLELAPSGLEERDVGDDIVEYAVYGAPGELPALPALRAAAGGALVDVTTSEVADDWAERWREFHRPVTVGGRVHVRAPWHESPPDGPLDVVIEPAQAFGTGAHATTRLCLELLLELEPGGPLVDLGCGSGVLAIAAAKLGWAPVLGVDHDPLALEATAENARANGVDVETRRHDLLRDGPSPAPGARAASRAPPRSSAGRRCSGSTTPRSRSRRRPRTRGPTASTPRPAATTCCATARRRRRRRCWRTCSARCCARLPRPG